MNETEYISVGFTLRWGDMRFLRAQADVFDHPKILFGLIADGYPDGMRDESEPTGNGIAIGKDLDAGALWFRAPRAMHKVGTHKGFLYSVSKTSDGYVPHIHLGFPVLVRECCVAGVWSIDPGRMERVRTIGHRFGAFRSIELAEKTLLFRIDKLAADS